MEILTENILFAYLGKWFVNLSFLSLILTVIFFFLSVKHHKRNPSSFKLAKQIYSFHLLFVSLASILLMYLLIVGYKEYAYVWKHSSSDMPWIYKISAFWAGQEGSLLFWLLSQAVIGKLLLNRIRVVDGRVMSIYTFTQLLLNSLLLGWNIFGVSIGQSPFELLRELPEFANEALFKKDNYLMFLSDGNGLNPLLRNFWMAIHPPLLFIGFSLLLVTYSISLARLYNNFHYNWHKIALPWTLIALFFLTLGLATGGAWAYKSLTFGGFWAWDPVENSSLVPWIILLASLHLLLLNNRLNMMDKTAVFITVLPFVFAFYSTFLTRSGVLNATSVHAFAESKLYIQLMLISVTLIVMPILASFIYSKKKVKDGIENQSHYMQWLFLGSVVLLLAAFQIIFTTSLPLINKLFEKNISLPSNIINFYNQWQSGFLFASLVTLFILYYYSIKIVNIDKKVFKKYVLVGVLSIVTTIFLSVFVLRNTSTYYLFLIGALLGIIYFNILFLLKNIRILHSLASVLSHLGIALFFLGVIIAFRSNYNISKDNNIKDSSISLDKNKPIKCDKFQVNYLSKNVVNDKIIYQIELKDTTKSDEIECCVLKPKILVDNKAGLVYEPYTKSYFTKDVYAYIQHSSMLLDSSFTLKYNSELKLKDSIFINTDTIVFDSIVVVSHDKNFNNVKINAVFSRSNNNFIESIRIPYFVENEKIVSNEIISKDGNLKFVFEGISDKEKTINIKLYELPKDSIILKIVVYPFINLMWAGLILLFIGIVIGIFNRFHQSKIHHR